MAAAVVPSVMVNLEALNHDNYEHWSFRVETYLMAEGLWDVVQGTDIAPKRKDGEAELKNNAKDGEAEFKAWQKNNAKALHAIHISCGKDAEFSIRGIKNARDAWNRLATKFKSVEILELPDSGESSEESTIVDLGESSEDPNDNTDSIDGGADSVEVEYAPFFENVRDRDWEAVKVFVKQHPEAVRVKSNFFGWIASALHWAVFLGDARGVKELLTFMKRKDLEILDNDGRTALSMAIPYGRTDDETEIVKCIVEKNKKLLLRGVDPSVKTIPLLYALSLDSPKVTRYLYSVTPLEKLKDRDRAELVSSGLRFKHLDIPLDLLQRFPNLAITKDHSGEFPLNELASTRAGLFSNASQLGIWKRLIYSCIHIPPSPIPPPTPPIPTPPPTPPTGDVSIDVPNEEKDQGNWKHLIRKVTCFFGRPVANIRHLSGIDDIYQMKLLHVQTNEILECMCAALHQDLNYVKHKFVVKALFQAIERGHAPFIQGIMYPSIMWDNRDIRSWFLAITNEHDKTIFQFAAEHRQEQLFDMLTFFSEKERKEIVGRKDKFGNNMLHVVGKLPPLTNIDHIRGAALQMQYELQWFKKVEHMGSPKDLNCINSDGRTPREEFYMNHRNLVEAGEKSMKETATSSSALVAALIITIMFAAAVTVPGGIKGETGIPIYLHTKAFRIFIVADVISLCSSTTSVMVFLGILTSRFAEEDFLTSLPTKLIIGFLTLFLSIAAMMIAFSSAIFIMLPEKPSIVIPSIVLASVPIASFLWMQFPFLLEIISSTYGSSVLVWWAGRSYRMISIILKGWALRIYWWLKDLLVA